jgi:hypothetical protein
MGYGPHARSGYVMRNLFCRCGYCRRQNRRLWLSLVNLVSAILWLISPYPANAPVRVRVEKD